MTDPRVIYFDLSVGSPQGAPDVVLLDFGGIEVTKIGFPVEDAVKLALSILKQARVCGYTGPIEIPPPVGHQH